MEEKVTLVTKRKQLQPAIDYCLDQRITFTINPVGLSPEDFHIELIVNGIKQALALGMFVKEHKFELLGLAVNAKPKTNSTPVKKSELKETVEVENASANNEQQSVTTELNF